MGNPAGPGPTARRGRQAQSRQRRRGGPFLLSPKAPVSGSPGGEAVAVGALQRSIHGRKHGHPWDMMAGCASALLCLHPLLGPPGELGWARLDDNWSLGAGPRCRLDASLRR